MAGGIQARLFLYEYLLETLCPCVHFVLLRLWQKVPFGTTGLELINDDNQDLVIVLYTPE
jgi:hypothetical protein